MTGAPNLYDFATSELSQDATLAYILSWAKPEFRDRFPDLNKLGNALLQALLSASRGAEGGPGVRGDIPIRKLEVGVKRDRVDVWAIVNDDICLIIEDKTKTSEHSDQVRRYIETAKGWQKKADGNWTVAPVYVKTGNESKYWQPDVDSCGMFMRRDLLNVLGQVPCTDNTVIEEFRRHLQRWQDDTESFRTTPWSHWQDWRNGDRSLRAMQGYYMCLEGWLRERPKVQSDCHWEYVPLGDYWAFSWHWQELRAYRCWLYLHIQDAGLLQIRVSDRKDESGGQIKVSADHLRTVHEAIEVTAKTMPSLKIEARRPRRYGNGRYATVADLAFDGEEDAYLVCDEYGRVDLCATRERLLQAMKLVDSVCGG